MTGHEDRMKELLRRYRLDRPLSPGDRRRIAARIGPVYRKVLKRAGLFTVFLGLHSFFYFSLKKIGAYVSLKAFAAAALISALAAGGVVAYLLLASAPRAVSPRGHGDAPVPPAEQAGAGDRAAAAVPLGVYPVGSGSLDARVLAKVNGLLRSELVRLKGAGFATFSPRGPETGYAMTGQIEKLDGSMVLFVKVVNTGTSAIVLVTREKIESEDELEGACRRISSVVANAVK